MRLAYVCYWSVFKLDGVATKIVSQADAWRPAGHEVEIFALSPQRSGPQRWAARAFTFRNPAERVLASVRLLRALHAYRPDAIYLRYDLLPPPLHAVVRIAPTVVEINTFPGVEYLMRKRRARLSAAYERINRRALLGGARGIVAVTRELARTVEGGGKPALVLGNAIDLDGVPELPPVATGRPTIAFIGTAGQSWQGFDELVALARAKPELDVIVIGDARPDDELPPNVEAHPFLPAAEYGPLLARADAAVGTAALHRKQMEEAAPLKVREYLASGLPVVLPYTDTDLAGIDDWWVLRLPNEPGTLTRHADAIVDFVRSVRGRRVGREVTAPLIGTGVRGTQRLEFLERCAARQA